MNFFSHLEKYIYCKISGEELSITLKEHENDFEWSCRIVLEIVENKKMYCLSDQFIKRFCSDCYNKVFSPVGASQLATFFVASISLQTNLIKPKYLDDLLLVLSKPGNFSEDNLSKINNAINLPMNENSMRLFIDFLRIVRSQK